MDENDKIIKRNKELQQKYDELYGERLKKRRENERKLAETQEILGTILEKGKFRVNALTMVGTLITICGLVSHPQSIYLIIWILAGIVPLCAGIFLIVRRTVKISQLRKTATRIQTENYEVQSIPSFAEFVKQNENRDD